MTEFVCVSVASLSTEESTKEARVRSFYKHTGAMNE